MSPTPETTHMIKTPTAKDNPRPSRKYGRCLICSKRLYNNDQFVTTSDGYCCSTCLTTIKQ